MKIPRIRFALPSTLFTFSCSCSMFAIALAFREGTDCCSSSLNRPAGRPVWARARHGSGRT
jgi:hypothetical protein